MNMTKQVSRSLGAMLMAGIAATTLTGCQEEGRVVTGSSDLNGLWRMTMKDTRAGTGLELGFTATVVDQGNSVTMKSCVERSVDQLNRVGNTLSPSPNGDIQIVNNDEMTAEGDMGPVEFQKMSVTPVFDLSSLRVMSTRIPPLQSADVCTTTVVAKMVGMSALETLTAYAPYQGSVLAVEFSKIAKFSIGDYSVGPVDSDVTVALESSAFESIYKSSRIDLQDGTLTITERSGVWIKGELDAYLPDNQAVSLEFELEMP